MRILKQSTAPIITFLLVSSADHVTGLTAATVAVKLSKNGGSGTTATNAVTQVDSVNLPGWYALILTATETNTIGDLIIRATATGADQTDRLCVVESADITDMDGEIDAVLTALSAIPTAPLLSSDTRLGNLDAAISSRLPTAGYVAPPATVVLASSQPNYAPAKESDAMTLTSAYDPAKTAIDGAGIAAAVWDTSATDHTTIGSFGYYLKRIFGWMFWRKDVTASQIKTYDADNSALLGTQTITGDGTTTSSVSKST